MSEQKTILVVEDEAPLRKALRIKLSEAGYNVLEADNGKDGLEILDKNSVDLILLDIMMPRMDGNVFTMKLNESRHKNIPVIVITNMSSVSVHSVVRKVLHKDESTLDDVTKSIKENLDMS